MKGNNINSLEFLISSTIGTSGWTVFVVGPPWALRMFCSISGLYPPDTSTNPSSSKSRQPKIIFRHCQTSSGSWQSGRGKEGDKSLLFQKHWSRGKKTTSLGVGLKFKPCYNTSYVITVILFFLPLISSCMEWEITSTSKDYCEEQEIKYIRCQSTSHVEGKQERSLQWPLQWRRAVVLSVFY